MPGGDVPQTQAPRRVDVRYLLMAVLLAGGLCAASFVKSDWTSNDFERFDDLRLTFLFFGLLGGACFAYAWMWLEPPRLSSATVLAVTAVALGALLASFPVGSKDVFLYSAFGKVWRTYHTNPYVVAPAAFVSDPWQPYLQVVWAKQPTPYGPLFVWEARLVDALAAGNLLAAVWVYKAVGAAALVGVMLLGARLMAAGDPVERAYRIALLAWNPLLLFECVGNGHNDAVVVLLLLAAVWLHVRGGVSRSVGGPAALALACWYKWYAVVFLAPFAVAMWREAGGDALRRWVWLTVVALLAAGVVLWAPLAEALPHIGRRLLSHENLRELFPLQLSPVLAVVLASLRTVGLTDTPFGLRWFDLLRCALFGLVGLVVLIAQGRGRLGLIEAVCALAVAFTQLIVSVLWPWHLVLPTAFALVATGPAWHALAVILTLLGGLSYFFTFTWTAGLLVVLGLTLTGLRRARSWLPR